MACYGMGVTQHRYGVETVRMVVNLLLLRGNNVQQVRPDTVFQAGDKVLAVAKGESGEDVLRSELIGDGEPVGSSS